MIKIISGKFGGTNLYVPDKIARPTTNRSRKVIFDVIQNYVRGADILDCFAGSGALAFEALSLGARSALCLEKNYFAFQVLQKNITKLKNSIDISTCQIDFFTFQTEKKFDIIFLDPPYQAYDFSEVLRYALLFCKEQTIIVYESNSLCQTDIPIWKIKKIGVVTLHFFMIQR